jgi:hypothetical protein
MDPEPVPLLFLDVNLGGSHLARLVINEGDNIDKIVDEFA